MILELQNAVHVPTLYLENMQRAYKENSINNKHALE